MSEKDLICKEVVDYSGVFDFPGLYSYAHSWLRGEENYGVVEEKYAEKVSGSSRDITIDWDATKGLSDYFKIQIKINFEIMGMTDVEAEIDGSKRKMNKGKIRIALKGILIRDPDSKWETSPFNKFIKDVYNKYVVPSRVENMQGKVMGDVIAFKDSLKEFLALSAKR